MPRERGRLKRQRRTHKKTQPKLGFFALAH
ncbi:hypothetical protein J2X52_000688 [Luteimonas sp. 3794]|nr:hypothetical protein [Luteimonas sp. 3794]